MSTQNATGQASTPFAPAAGSAFVRLPRNVEEEIRKLMRAAWLDGFDAETSGDVMFFDGFAIAGELLNEPRRVCCKCSSRLCDFEEDEMCRECWDASIATANATREARIAAGWMVGPDGGIVPPNAQAEPRREDAR